MEQQREQSGGLTVTEYLIMQMLVEGKQKEMYGLELVKASKGKLKRGSVYVLLGRLEEKGFVKSRTEVEGAEIPRRVYKPTGLGIKVFMVWRRVVEVGGLRGVEAA
jgi:DNA-binding PadR family transcriptional regulator